MIFRIIICETTNFKIFSANLQGESKYWIPKKLFLWGPKIMSISDKLSGQQGLLVPMGPKYKMCTIKTECGKGLTNVDI